MDVVDNFILLTPMRDTPTHIHILKVPWEVLEKKLDKILLEKLPVFLEKIFNGTYSKDLTKAGLIEDINNRFIPYSGPKIIYNKNDGWLVDYKSLLGEFFSSARTRCYEIMYGLDSHLNNPQYN